ncbi:serine hydrolase [Piscinibacter sp. HJYY11]|uniref:serine hydrolase domain-containing protein n=1 Tax=Piscinibacter sp. HJYY11 TaxID=2801333 RepID=UPI00191E1F5A|nr:serine hydrolase [Piscinibacter sp. HJYY11]MBL0726896.1 serine hydrolase [Piscinibacter sp. HJYY11]
MTQTYTEAALAAARAAAAFNAEQLDADASDPQRLGWMTGAPPAPERRMAFADNSRNRFPQIRWSFSHQRHFLPTSPVWRGEGPVSALPRALEDFGALRFTPIAADKPMSWADGLKATWTDGVVVLHKGRIVDERYFGALQPHLPHLAMSVTKSFVATVAASLVAEGSLDETRRVDHFVPELAGSGFGDATVRQVLDMRTGIAYTEDYLDPESGAIRLGRAIGLSPRRPDDAASLTDYLRSIAKQGEHGQAFTYKTANTDVLAWVLMRVTGVTLSELLHTRLWAPLGMEQDAYFAIDAWGTEFAGGGLNLALRDMARFGEAMRCDGVFNGRQVVPASVVADIRRGGERGDCERAGFPILTGWSYRSMWWVSHNAHGAFMARGIHGQAIYVDPVAEVVIARFASHPGAGNMFNDPVSLPAYHAVAQALRA